MTNGESRLRWTSPFSALPRWEVEYPHFYHLPPDLHRELQGEGSVYLLGTRGTGKTTYLMSLHWKERINNPNLEKLIGTPRVDGLIGLYQKVPEARFDLLENALAENFAPEKSVAAYLDCFSIQLMAGAVSDLRTANEVVLDAADERAVAEAGLKCLGRDLRPRQIPTLRDLEEAAHDFAQRLEDAAESGHEVPDTMRVALSHYREGTMSRDVADTLAAALTRSNAGVPWRFRHCLDEAEALSIAQQRSLASAIRLSRHSLTYVAAFTQVSVDPSATGLPYLDLSEHDVRTISLDWFADKKTDYNFTLESFRVLAAGVLRLRLEAWQASLPQKRSASEELESIGSDSELANAMESVVLPRLSIDERLERHVASSDVPMSHRIFQVASAKREPEIEPSSPTKRPRLSYKEYLRSRGFGESHGEVVGGRQQDNAEFRKRMVAAYLSICDEMNWDPIYCGWEELLQLSDLCIRDFIWQMREIWREADPRDVSHFLATPISAERQSRALKAASAKKIAFSRKYLTVSPARTRRLVEGLCILTRELQARHDDPSVIASPERGFFVVTRHGSLQSDVEMLSLISDAARQGYLKLLSSSGNALTFRVHRCMAPLSGFSYRRPQYPFSIKITDIARLSLAPDEETLRRIVNLLIDPQHDQLELFGTEVP